jgi:chromosome segregation ATPase
MRMDIAGVRMDLIASEIEAQLDKLESYVKKIGQTCERSVYLRRRMLGAGKEFPRKYDELRRELDAHSAEQRRLLDKIAKAEREVDSLFAAWLGKTG